MNASWKLFVPTTGAYLFLCMLGCLLFLKPHALLADGAAARHITNGLYILSHHSIPHTNFVSALYPNLPITTSELFCDLILGSAYSAWQLNGVVLIGVLAITLAVTWSYQLSRARGLGLYSGLVLAMLTMAATSMHWSARAHLFSYLFMLLLYYFATMSKAPFKWRLLGSALTMFFWTNFHGSFVLGLILLALKTGADIVETNYAGLGLKEIFAGPVFKENMAMVGVCLLATCLNVRGPQFYSYIAGYMLNSTVMQRTEEWHSIDFGGAAISTWAFLALSWLLVALWLASGVKPKLWEFLFLSFLFVSALHGVRMMPYFALAALPAFGPGWLKLRAAKISSGTICGQFTGFVFQREEKMEQAEVRAERLNYVFLGLALAMSCCFLLVPAFRVADFDENHLPVGAVNYMADHHVQGLGYNFDNWGRYLYLRLNRPIYVDDNGDSYPRAFMDEYLAVLQAQAGWQDVLQKYHFQWVLVPNSTMLGAALRCSPAWQLVFQDNGGQLFLRKGAS